MNELEMRALYEAVLRGRAADGRDNCLSPEALLDLADGKAPKAQRLRHLAHVAACPFCREELALARSTVEAGRAIEPRRRRSTVILALAASLGLVIAGSVIGRGRSRLEPEIMRGSSVPSLIQPIGDLDQGRGLVLLWHSVPRATRYDVEILDPTGAPAFIASTPDTSLVVPPQTASPGVEYLWRVTAPLNDGGRLSSAAQPFRLRNP